jgi:hypothetical protein
MDLLRAELADGEHHPVAELFKSARTVGISDRTLQRARKRLGVETEKSGFDGGWGWSLPKASSETSKPAFLHEGSSPRETAPSMTPSQNGTPALGEEGFPELVLAPAAKAG